MKPSEFKIYLSFESNGEKTTEHYRNCYVAKKAHSFQTIKYIDPEFNDNLMTEFND